MLKQIIATVAMILSVANIGNVQYAKVDSVEYCESMDYYSTTFETHDGNLWVVDDYITVVGADCLLVMDDKGTESIFDDEVKMVLTFTATK